MENKNERHAAANLNYGSSMKEVLRESEERFRLTFEEGPVGMAMVDQWSKFIKVNDAFCKIVGFSKAELSGRSFTDITCPDDVRKDTENLAKLMSGELAKYYTEKRYISKNREIVCASTTVATVRNVRNEFLYFLAIVENITERRRAEEESFNSRQMLQLVLDTIPQRIFWKDRDSLFLGCNKPFAQDAGLGTPDEIVGKDDFQCAWKDTAQLYREDDTAVMKTDVAKLNFEEPQTRPDGSRQWLRTSKVPLHGRSGDVIGVMGTYEDITERKRSEVALKESCAKLKKTIEGIIEAITTIVEIRDPYTAGHQKRVSLLASAIALEMGLTEETVHTIRVAAVLHDIGKIYVPTEILSKPGQLTSLEMDIVKMHPQDGCAVLRKIELPWPIAEITLQHQERVNGSGYPQGLAENGILLEARILAVADVVEAIMSTRPYRSAQGIHRALDEVTKNRGILYDPDAVDACVRLFREKRFKFDETVQQGEERLW
jgi:PAS domain S-box-containing protein/putative nucleotidyltransferase with HDIG domain